MRTEGYINAHAQKLGSAGCLSPPSASLRRAGDSSGKWGPEGALVRILPTFFDRSVSSGHCEPGS